eukprot:symbB.v1.2.035362.t2/scaffold4742.1/size35533/2
MKLTSPTSRHDMQQLLKRHGKRQLDPEMQELQRRVEDLIKLVDEFDAKDASTPVSTEELIPVRKAYDAFAESLEMVSAAVLESKPLSVTSAWAPLLLRFRYYLCGLFSWGVLTEKVIREVSEELNRRGAEGLCDPLAGTGWHARLFEEVGHFPVLAMDSNAGVLGAVRWHSAVKVVADSRTTAWHNVSNVSRWVLLLSWPPHSPEPIGHDLLQEWPGHWVIYLGEKEIEEEMGIDKGLRLMEELRSNHWEPLKTWPVVRWHPEAQNGPPVAGGTKMAKGI